MSAPTPIALYVRSIDRGPVLDVLLLHPGLPRSAKVELMTYLRQQYPTCELSCVGDEVAITGGLPNLNLKGDSRS
jgi:hypothetical protein